MRDNKLYFLDVSENLVVWDLTMLGYTKQIFTSDSYVAKGVEDFAVSPQNTVVALVDRTKLEKIEDKNKNPNSVSKWIALNERVEYEVRNLSNQKSMVLDSKHGPSGFSAIGVTDKEIFVSGFDAGSSQHKPRNTLLVADIELKGPVASYSYESLGSPLSSRVQLDQEHQQLAQEQRSAGTPPASRLSPRSVRCQWSRHHSCGSQP